MRKREDELIELAFGELDSAIADQVRQSCDESSRKVLAEYEAMCQGLKQLGDIPEMQLSNQRLRDAILQAGLKPGETRKPIFNWNLLAWPVAACLAVSLFVNLNSRNNPVPPAVVVQNTAADSAVLNPNYSAKSEPKILSLDPTLNPELLAKNPEVTEAPTTPPVVVASANTSKTIFKRSSKPKGSAIVAKNFSDSPSRNSILARDFTPTAKETREEDISSNALHTGAPITAAAASSEQGENPIVMIDPTSSTTSADSAKEVAADNVVIGG